MASVLVEPKQLEGMSKPTLFIDRCSTNSKWDVFIPFKT